MKKTLAIVALSLLLTMAMSSAYAYEAFHGPSETIYWDPDKAYNGYTLIGSTLIDMEGNVVYKFPQGGFLWEDGTLFTGGGGPTYTKWDMNGNKIWTVSETRTDLTKPGYYKTHHDSSRVFNKKLGRDTVIYVANKSLTHDEVIAAGANPAWKASYTGSEMDCLVERDSLDNKVVWEWCMYDHLIQDLDPTKKNYVAAGKGIKDYPGKLNINYGKTVGGDWNHVNGMDYSDQNGQILFDMVWGEIWIIDHDGTFVSSAADFTADPAKALAANIAAAASVKGDFLWRFGDPALYQQGTQPQIDPKNYISLLPHHKMLGKCHDVQWIKPGLPGAGNVLISNNGDYYFEAFPQSSGVEINPYIKGIDATTKKPILSTSYVNPPDAGYYSYERRTPIQRMGTKLLSNQIVWFWQNQETSGFLKDNGGNIIRLPNGNTLQSGKTEGHLVEVTPEMEVVWEYINPVTSKGIVTTITPGMLDTHSVGKVGRYAADFPPLRGLDLTPKGKLTGLGDSGEQRMEDKLDIFMRAW